MKGRCSAKPAKKTTPQKGARTRADPKPAGRDSRIFESEQWQMANSLSNMDAAECRHVVLGLILLKYVSYSFVERHEKIRSSGGRDPEDRDGYAPDGIFWVPKSALAGNRGLGPPAVRWEDDRRRHGRH